jgi:hypothetical protein
VSFSEYIDRTSYKSGQSVKSMKTCLKNKRRRARKHEERIKSREEHQQQGSRRSRRLSSGSDPSSDEQRTSLNGDESPEEDNLTLDDCEKGQCQINGDDLHTTNGNDKGHEQDLEGATSSQGSLEGQGEAVATKNKNKKSKRKNRKNKNGGKEKTEGLDERTSGSEGDAHSDVNQTPQVLPSPSLSQGDEANVQNPDTSKNGGGDLSSKIDKSQDKYRTSLSDGNNNTGFKLEKEAQEEIFKPETMLSWAEPPPSTNEMKSQCAFQFTNTVMFDLDED